MQFQKKTKKLTKRSKPDLLIWQNTRFARSWGITRDQVNTLKALTEELNLSLALGDLRLLDGKWYVTHSGLLRLARRNRCAGIQVQPLTKFCEPTLGRWVFRASVKKSHRTGPFIGYGDADPSNVSHLVQGAEMRVAETRAVNRALRKAYGIGLCSVEELGAVSGSAPSGRSYEQPPNSTPQNGSNNGQPRLRDKLCLLIRRYNLDSNLVKAYAADFCGTETLRGASRELVESFVAHIEKEARENRDRLVCKLNSYSQPVEVQS